MNNVVASVAMCTFNGEDYLQKQLESILEQRRQPDEIIICDDCSKDRTVTLLREFTKRAHCTVHLYKNEKTIGPAKNFEQAISHCCGEIIVLCDQDDVWRDDKIECLVDSLQKTATSLYAFSDAEMITADGLSLGYNMWDAVGIRQTISQFVGTEQLAVLLKYNRIPGSALAFRSSMRDIILPIPNGWMHDHWLVILGSILREGIVVPKTLYQYRQHRAQVCGWRKKTFVAEFIESLGTNKHDAELKVRQFQEIEKRLAELNLQIQVPPESLILLREKEAHLKKRAAIRSRAFLARVSDVLSEAMTGRYHRFSDSWWSILRDL